MKTKLLGSIYATMALVAITVITSCKKESVAPAGWFTKNRDYYYDYATDTSNIVNYRQLSVIPGFAPDELFFYESSPDTNIIISGTQVFEIFGNGLITPKDDGLYQESAGTCGFGFSFNDFKYLFIPAWPEAGQRVPQYGCAHTDEGTNTILNTDTAITVPAGTYHTFCVLHPNGDKSYWSREVGIIMYDQWQHDRALPLVRLGSLKLRRMD